MVDIKKYTLDVDLKQGVVPISKAASSLAALIKRSRANHQPIIVTQKGYPTGVILDVELFTALRQIAEDQLGEGGLLELGDEGEVEAEEVETAEA
ncbi:type II toxin-antitoxin system Phd/YefM family antitoxin [Candidatus Viridilinea mediisalina]|uniref:Antitoxin n=1 Tax=Candidatus Viridilinea mediisalina TaxID=2024553 RepID=A0A2A6RKY0_9CHLR|nr:type II toxin-antitoxin system Phd/YefM family antitoxin [Candidatus Viridilinea mediisalina]PDW03774.1 type II toxin-antitoxin system prevent-host-death family antitoxin [Candidatus Viridilinea mediisalina]